MDKFLNIDEETELLINVKDIQDEIRTILMVINDQLTVLTKFTAEAKSIPSSPIGEAECLDNHQMITNNIRDFEKMAIQATNTYDAVSNPEFDHGNLIGFGVVSISFSSLNE